jgi:predicted nucleic acid-binding protein
MVRIKGVDMANIFADTSGLAALIDNKQMFHRLAKMSEKIIVRTRAKFVTTNYVIAELVALLTSPIGLSRPAIVREVNRLKRSTYIDIIHFDPALDNDAWNLLQNRPDKDWSLVDCSSFVIMQQLGLREALTTDRHFEQAGFIRLLK